MANKIKWSMVGPWLIAGVLLFTWSGIAAGRNAAEKDRVKDESAQIEKREHFYRVIAGELPGSEPGPANKLARDLRDLPEDEIDSFTGDSNRYGGITDDLGFDPFNGLDCHECGPLDRSVVDDVEEIKNGDLDEVMDHYAVDPADTGSGPSKLIYFLWIISLPAFAGYLFVRNRRAEETKYREFVDERRLIGKLREASHELSPGNRQSIEDLADKLQSEIDTRVTFGQTKARQMKLEALIDEAGEVLGAIEAGNRTLN